MSAQTTKGRFIVNYLNEGEKLDVLLDLNQRYKQDTDEENEKMYQDVSLSSQNKYNNSFLAKVDKETNTIEMNPDSTAKKQEYSIRETIILKNNCLKAFQDQMNSKYIEIINFNKDEMLKYIRKDTERQKKIMKLLEDIAGVTRQNLFIEQENARIKKLLIDKGKL